MSTFATRLGCLYSMLAFAANKVEARDHTQVIEKFSFDMDEMVYPKGYDTYGVAVSLATRVKLVPNIPEVSGQIFT
jgi:hypothetical protein